MVITVLQWLRERGFRFTFQFLISPHSSYFLDQNSAIAAGTISGITINLKVLGIGNGLTVCSAMRTDDEQFIHCALA